MKKYLLGLAAVVVALSSSAFTGEGKRVVVKGATTNLHWFEPPYATGDFQVTTTSISQRTDVNECVEDAEIECERAYLDNQFLTPGVPGSGFKPNQQQNPAEVIYLDEN